MSPHSAERSLMLLLFGMIYRPSCKSIANIANSRIHKGKLLPLPRQRGPPSKPNKSKTCACACLVLKYMNIEQELIPKSFQNVAKIGYNAGWVAKK